MGDSAASNESAYQAALITEQRALDGHTQAIDLLQRLLDSMGDDPLLVQTKTNLQKILENPEVITDEVFNNIMSKTGEILDTNYDQQVQEVLGAARAKGVSGPALQVTLQKAKQQRAVAMAGAYREAIIARSESGLKTNMEAIASATSLLNNLFTNQRVASEDLATVMREVVPAPFRNYGVDDVQAGGSGGNGASLSTAGGGQVSTAPSGEALGAWGERMAAQQAAAAEAEARATDLANAKSDAEFKAYWDKWGVNGTAMQKAQDQANAGKPVTTVPATPAALTPEKLAAMTADERIAAEGPASGTGTVIKDGKMYQVDAQGNIKLVDYADYDTSNRNGGVPLMTQNPNPLSAPSTPSTPNVSTSSSPTGAELMQSQIKAAMAPLTSVASTVQNNFAPSQPISVLKPVDYGTTLGEAYNNGKPYTEQTITTPAGGAIVAGGNAAEASRGAQLVATYGADKVLGSTAGYGVRQTGTIAGSASAGDALSAIYDSNKGYRGPVSTAAVDAQKASTSAEMNPYAAEIQEYNNAKTELERAAAYTKLMAARKKKEQPGSNVGTVIETSSGTGYRHA